MWAISTDPSAVASLPTISVVHLANADAAKVRMSRQTMTTMVAVKALLLLIVVLPET